MAPRNLVNVPLPIPPEAWFNAHDPNTVFSVRGYNYSFDTLKEFSRQYEGLIEDMLGEWTGTDKKQNRTSTLSAFISSMNWRRGKPPVKPAELVYSGRPLKGGEEGDIEAWKYMYQKPHGGEPSPFDKAVQAPKPSTSALATAGQRVTEGENMATRRRITRPPTVGGDKLALPPQRTGATPVPQPIIGRRETYTGQPLRGLRGKRTTGTGARPISQPVFGEIGFRGAPQPRVQRVESYANAPRQRGPGLTRQRRSISPGAARRVRRTRTRS
jgi:hypothetical protein